jgi:hypothetical protein
MTTCPVGGKVEIAKGMTVSHLACVEKLKAENERLRDEVGDEWAKRSQAEAKLESQRKNNLLLLDKMEQAEAENRQLNQAVLGWAGTSVMDHNARKCAERELAALRERRCEEQSHYLHKCRKCDVELPWTDGTDTEYWCQSCGYEQPATWTEVRWVVEETTREDGEYVSTCPVCGKDYWSMVLERPVSHLACVEKTEAKFVKMSMTYAHEVARLKIHAEQAEREAAFWKWLCGTDHPNGFHPPWLAHMRERWEREAR